MSFNFKPPRNLIGQFGSWYHNRQKQQVSEEKKPPLPTNNEASAETCVDLYGFEYELSPRQQAGRLKCENKARSRAERWSKFQDTKELPAQRKNPKLKQLIRKGIPPSLRSWVWMETSGARERMENTPAEKSYTAYLEKALQESPFAKQIELDLPRTFPGHPWLQSEVGQKSLQRVLLAYAARNQRTGYCQSMNYIAAMLLLVLDTDEEKAFWLLSTLIEDILYAGTYEKNLNGCHVEMRSLGELIASKMPRLSKHLEELGCEMSLIATDWYLCLFCTSLPSETCVRIWDSLFYEGPKILFRVAVALLQICERSMLRYDNAGEILRGVKEIVKGIHHRDKLMKISFEGIGGLPMNTIKSVRKMKQRDVDQMLRVREERMSAATIKNKNRWTERDAEDSDGYYSDGQSSIATAITEAAELSS